MSRINRVELEAQLQADWSPDLLSVYADVLQTEGDPRGELIAFDVRMAAQGRTDEINAAHQRLVTELLGDWLAGRLARSTVAFGFLEDLVLDDAWHGNLAETLSAVMACPLGPYTRGITLHGSNAWLKTAIRQLSLVSPMHWLRRLSISAPASSVAMPWSKPLASRRTTAALIAATPRLETLEIRGRLVFPDFAHPNVTTWDLSHSDSIG